MEDRVYNDGVAMGKRAKDMGAIQYVKTILMGLLRPHVSDDERVKNL